MPKETLNTRVTRLETAMAELAEKMTTLVDVQIRAEEHTTKLDEQARERDRLLDERIEKLVSAIGDLLRARNGKPT